MKFSKLEQEQMKKLCEWAKEANRFMPIRDYYACSGLEEGTGIICIYDEKVRQPMSILYVDEDKCKENEFEKIREYENYCLFRFCFIYKLERLGLVTISKTSYPNTDSKGWACFSGYTQAAAIDIIDGFNGYTFLLGSGKDLRIVEMDYFGDLSDRVTREVFEYSHKEISSKLDIFGLVSSVISLEQELFELVSNGFKTYEDIQLEEAQKQSRAAKIQVEIAQKTLSESQRQICVVDEKFNELIKESKEQFFASQSDALYRFNKAQENAEKQFIIAQENSYNQFVAAQQSSNDQFEKANEKASQTLVCAVFTLIASILMPFVLSKCSTDPIVNKIDPLQFDSIQIKQNELINTLKELKAIQITNDSMIKELNLANQSIDEISNTLKEVKELNSKRK